MRNKSFIMAALASFIAFSSLPSFAAKPIDVLVIDSGSDFTHKELKPMANPNLPELKGTEKVDDDNNGYVDDVYGWNFVENNSTLVNLRETPPEYDKVLEVMKNINKMQQSGKEAFTTEEWNAFVDLYNNPKLKPWVNFCGGWAHGTHCAGIIASNNKNVAFKAIRHIPTGQAPSRVLEDGLKKVSFKVAQRTKRNGPTMEEISQYFDEVGKENAEKMKSKADYIAKFNPRLINCSFGTPNASVLNMMKLYSMQWGMGSLSDAEKQCSQEIKFFSAAAKMHWYSSLLVTLMKILMFALLLRRAFLYRTKSLLLQPTITRKSLISPAGAKQKLTLLFQA